MPTALVINPNTSATMSAEIRVTAERVFQDPWNCRVVNAPAGPESLESWRDYQLAGAAILPLLAEHKDVDGIVLACFGDPGLFALKELSAAPVVGIAEASIALATLLGGKFGILAAMNRAVGLMDAMVRQYGMEARYAGTVGLNMRVLSFHADPAGTLEGLVRASSSIAGRGADVLLLGCAGLTGFTFALKERVALEIIDPVEAGCRALKTLVEAGLKTGRGGLYASPPRQKMNHLEQIFSSQMSDYLRTWETE